MIAQASTHGRIGPAATRLPERMNREWALMLAYSDVLAVLTAAYAGGIAAPVAPAVCLIAIGSLWLCGAFRTSYAVHARDEVYAVLVAGAVALLPLYALLHFVAGLEALAPLRFVAIAFALLAVTHVALHAVRRRSRSRPDAGAAYVSPQAQWRAANVWSRASKRAVDLILTCGGLILAAPVMAVVAVAIFLESGGPVFFVQDRVGRNGTLFTMFKFRTMRPDAGKGWARLDDARITRVGSWLRRTSLDELPQLFNVIRGEMSLVGPRPEMVDYARSFRTSIPHYDERHLVQPGLTGWAQIHCKRNLAPSDVPDVVPFDLFYVENAGRLLDAVVILKTAAEFLFHRAV